MIYIRHVLYSHLLVYHVTIYHVSLFTVNCVLRPNTVVYIKYVLNVFRFTVHPDIPCISLLPRQAR